MDGIDIEDNENNPIEVFINSNTKNNDNTSGILIVSGLTASSELAANVSKTNSDFDNICSPYIRSKSTQVVI